MLGQLEAPQRPAAIAEEQALHLRRRRLRIVFVEGVDLVELGLGFHSVQRGGPAGLFDGGQAARAVAAGQPREEAEEPRRTRQRVDVVVVQAEPEEHVGVFGVPRARRPQVLAHLRRRAGGVRAAEPEQVVAAAHAAGRAPREERARVGGIRAHARVRHRPRAVRRLLERAVEIGLFRPLLDDPGQGQRLEVHGNGVFGMLLRQPEEPRLRFRGAAVVEQVQGGPIVPVHGGGDDAGGQQEGRRSRQR